MSTDVIAFVNEASSPTPASPSFVVGIGASAGGLDALERFFDNVPRDAGLAYVLVQHLSPDFRSLMDQLLARHTDLPIRLVEDGMRVHADHVYLIPPKKEMIISGGRLLLSERDRQHELTLPIDVFFRSLAQDCRHRAIAVVLSGGGTDGSRGIRAVHDAGGLVIVQDVGTAQFDGMPKTARDAGVADWVLPPQEMPRVIVDHARRPSTTPRPKADGRTQGLAAVYEMLETEFGLDFMHYKPSTVTRRIERRLRLSRAEHMDEYVERLRRGRDELDVLYRDLLIGVTRFFRNEEAFAVLGERVLPELMQRCPRDAPLRVWVAGCATGEEVYSLAILLDETTSRIGGPHFKIFATDVHRGSIEIASRATYGEEAMAHVSAERRRTYFRARGRAYEVVPDLRQHIVFAQHNVIKDPPFTRVDLVSCRNLLIYLQPAAQAKALSLFHFALKRGGVLFLGPSESPGPLASDFESLDRHWRIYRKFSPVRIPFEERLRPPSSPPSVTPAAPAPNGPVATRASSTPPLAVYDALLDRFMPPSLLLTAGGELLHAFGGASRFLRVPDGRAPLDLLEMTTDELRTVLAAALRRARAEAAVVFRGIRAGHDDSSRYTITISRVGSAADAHVLVSFEPAHEPFGAPSAADSRELTLDDVSGEQIRALEAELNYTKENLQAAIEELQASNEELQTANEELLTSNEELQSTNEELQSVNEELYTVNAEYQRKIAELTELTNDVDNLLASTDVGTIFVDQQLKIRKFTPHIASGFDLLPQDIGRPIETFRHDLDHPGLAEELRRVLATGERIEVELRERNGRTYFLRILPYRAKGAIAGVVLTIVDVTAMKAAEDALFHERYLLNSLLSSVPDAIYFKDGRGKFIRANAAMAARLGLGEGAELVGKTALELPAQTAALALHQQDEIVLRSGAPQHYRLERRERPDGPEEWDLVTRLPLRDGSGAIVGVIGIFRDVTLQKRAEEKIQEAVRRRDQFLAMLSHELRNPLAAVVTATSLLKRAVGAAHPRMLDILERQSQQMARLLDDLLEASRVTENKIELRREVIDLAALARDAAEAARSLIEGRGLAFAVDVTSEPIWVEGDTTRLQQIQANLLNNAAKYTPRGGHVSFVVAREADEAVIRVRDDGAGIAKDMLETVFDLFVQAGRTLDRAQGGIGVGLTLVRSLVRMHGGSVVAVSEGEGRGTEMIVRLPVTDPRTPGTAAEPRPGFVLRRGAKIAIIEDNRDSREMLCEILSHAGFDCSAADNGAAGLALIEAVRPDLAVVDVGLPELDGLELARRVRAAETGRRMVLVALTGYGQREDRERALAAGFDLHLTKPLDPAHLLGLIHVQEPER